MSGLSVRPDGNVSLTVRFAVFTDMSKDGKTAKLFAIQNSRTSRKVGAGDKDCATNAIAAKEITWSLCQDAAELAGVSLKTDDERNTAKSRFAGSITWSVGNVTVVASPDDGNPNRTAETLMLNPPSYPVPEKKVKAEKNTVAVAIDF